MSAISSDVAPQNFNEMTDDTLAQQVAEHCRFHYVCLFDEMKHLNKIPDEKQKDIIESMMELLKKAFVDQFSRDELIELNEIYTIPKLKRVSDLSTRILANVIAEGVDPQLYIQYTMKSLKALGTTLTPKQELINKLFEIKAEQSGLLGSSTYDRGEERLKQMYDEELTEDQLKSLIEAQKRPVIVKAIPVLTDATFTFYDFVQPELNALAEREWASSESDSDDELKW